MGPASFFICAVFGGVASLGFGATTIGMGLVTAVCFGGFDWTPGPVLGAAGPEH